MLIEIETIKMAMVELKERKDRGELRSEKGVSPPENCLWVALYQDSPLHGIHTYSSSVTLQIIHSHQRHHKSRHVSSGSC